MEQTQLTFKYMQRTQRGFTLIELLVVIAIIALLAAILFPVFGRARENARRSTCQSNLKQIGLAFTQYSQDYDETYPINTYNEPNISSWDVSISPYLGTKVQAGAGKGTGILQCPSDTTKRTFSDQSFRSYSMAGAQTYGNFVNPVYLGLGSFGDLVPGASGLFFRGVPLSKVQAPTTSLLVAERPTSRNAFGGGEGWLAEGPGDKNNQTLFATGQMGDKNNPSPDDPKAPIHFEGWNYLFFDGHVKWLKPQATLGPAAGGDLNAFFPFGMWTLDPND